MKNLLIIVTFVAMTLIGFVAWKAVSHNSAQVATPVTYDSILTQIKANNADQISSDNKINAGTTNAERVNMVRQGQLLDKRGIKGVEKQKLMNAEAARMRGPRLVSESYSAYSH